MNSSQFSLAWFLRPRVLLLAVVGLAMLAYAFFNVLGAAGAGSLSVSPSNQTVNVGSSVSIDINIAGVSNYQGANVTVTYDPTLISSVTIANGSLLEQVPLVATCSAGSCNYQGYHLNPPGALSASGTLFTINGVAGPSTGTAPISITSSIIYNPDIDPITHSSVNGSITVASSPTTGSITAHKWRDDNQNGFQGGIEPDLSGWTMTLYSGSFCSGSALGSGATDSNGDEVFSGLAAGTYSVKETLKTGWTNTTGLCQTEALTAGENATLSFGNIQNIGSITAHKFRDDNSNTTQSTGEPDLSGWTMTLYSGSICSGGALDSGSTNANGDEVFSGLAAGTYSVKETLKTGWANTTSLCQNETLTAGENATLNFGNVQNTGSITAHKFRDDNKTGVQSSSEPDLSGWTMTLYSGSSCSGGALDSGSTNANGDEVFSGLAAGTYSVKETLKTGWTSTTSVCQNETLTAGENATLNFGNVEEEGTLWGDVDCDGEVDSGDAMKIAQWVAGLDPVQELGCPDIEDSVIIVEP